MYQSWTVIDIWSLKDIRVTFLTFCGHVTSSVTWPFDSSWGVSYRWSMVASRLSGTVIEIFSLEDNGVTTLTFGVTWRHRSRDHSTPHVGVAIGCQRSPCVCLERSMRYWASKILGSRHRPFGVTWRHRSRDRSTPHAGFPIGGQWWLYVYLARLLRYSAWNILQSRPWPVRSRDVIDHVTIRLPMDKFFFILYK